MFGWVNQLIGLVTALMLMVLSALGIYMWLKRRPSGEIGAPGRTSQSLPRWTLAAVIALALLLPLFGITFLVVMSVDALWKKLRFSPTAHTLTRTLPGGVT